MRFSKFVRQYDWSDKRVLFNTYNKALVMIDGECMENDTLKESFPAEYSASLEQMGFFISDDYADDLIGQAIKRDKKLMLSVETSLSCNMRCPYCYQGSQNKLNSRLSVKHIADLIRYCEIVACKYEFEEVVLKVLGGEPTIVWSIAKKVIDGISDFCRKYNKKFNLMIDTNGVLIDDILQLRDYDSLLLTIPLTYKLCHNNVRKLANGEGSYDVIVSNLRKIHELKPETVIVLRHNTDDENIKYFDEYVKDLKNSLNYNPLIDLSYTAELGDEEFKNGLSFEDFIEWKSSKAIDILVNNDCNVTIAPVMSTDRCQHRSKYSLKLFSDGTVGSCAMWFFRNKRIELSALCADLDLIERLKGEGEELFEKCGSCRSFFLCGAGYNLPCIKSLKIKECAPDGEYCLNLESFIKRYIQYKAKGKESLFVGFNNRLVIR